MTGNIWDLGQAFVNMKVVDASAVGQVSNLSEPGQVENLSHGEFASAVAVTGYNSPVAASDLESQDQFFRQYPGNADPEARPAMNPVLLPEIEPADEPITPAADQPPLANPVQLREYADPFADVYLGLGILAFSDTNDSLAPTGGEGWGEGVGGGGAPFSSDSPTRSADVATDRLSALSSELSADTSGNLASLAGAFATSSPSGGGGGSLKPTRPLKSGGPPARTNTGEWQGRDHALIIPNHPPVATRIGPAPT